MSLGAQRQPPAVTFSAHRFAPQQRYPDRQTGGPEGPPVHSVQEFVDYFRLRINTSPPKAKASKESVPGSGTVATFVMEKSST